MRIRQKRRFGVVVALTAIIAVLGVATPAAAIGPYWKTIGDTGIRCTNVGAQVYKSTYSLSSSQMIQVIRSRVHVRTELNGDSSGTYKHWSRAQTYSRADKYNVCNRLHTTSSGYYYTYQEIHYLASPVTKCLLQYGVHVGGIPYTASYSWVGSTYAGHVTSNPCSARRTEVLPLGTRFVPCGNTSAAHCKAFVAHFQPTDLFDRGR